MRETTIVLAALLLLVPPVARTQVPAVAGPSLGMVFDAELRSLRPILGLPGAAMLGHPYALDITLSQAWAAPVRNYALAASAGDSSLVLVRGANDALVATPLRESFPGLTSITFSSGGTAAAIYMADSRKLAIVKGLPDAPVSGEFLTVPDAAGPFALTDDGESVVVAAGPIGSRSLYRLAGDSFAPVPVSFRSVASMRFGADKADLFVADSLSDSIYAVHDAAGSAETTLLGSALDGLVQPEDLWPSPDGNRIFVAGKTTGSVTVIHRDGGPPVRLDCACSPALISGLAQAEVFRITDPVNSVLWVLETGRAGPRLLAVPPEPPGSESETDVTGGLR